MIQAILGIILAAWLAYGLFQVLIGLFQIVTGILGLMAAAVLYLIAYLLEYSVRAVRFLWRLF